MATKFTEAFSSMRALPNSYYCLDIFYPFCSAWIVTSDLGECQPGTGQKDPRGLSSSFAQSFHAQVGSTVEVNLLRNMNCWYMRVCGSNTFTDDLR